MSEFMFIVDWDGTCVEDGHWPEQGPWLPGAPHALRKLLEHGRVKVYSTRTNPYAFGEDSKRYRPWRETEDDILSIREMLTGQGLHGVEIHTTHGKPAGTHYIDNLAVEFDGNWEKVLDKLFVKVPTPDWNTVRHPESKRFHEILAELGSLHDQKQSDYGRGNDPFANVRASTEWNVPAWVGAMVRANDKVRRLQTQAIRGSLTNESALDAFNDLAVYAVIARVLFEQE